MFINNSLFLLAGRYRKEDLRETLRNTEWDYQLRWRRKDTTSTMFLNLNGDPPIHLSFEDTSEQDTLYMEEYVLIAQTPKGVVVKRAQSAIKLLQNV